MGLSFYSSLPEIESRYIMSQGRNSRRLIKRHLDDLIRDPQDQ